MSPTIKAFRLLPLILALLVGAGCRSTDHHEGDATVKAADATAAPAATAPKGQAAGLDCARHPEPALCCEALTPSCNECRAKVKQEAAAWQAKCVKAAYAPK